MGSGKWLGAFFGMLGAGPLGALGGFIIGSLYDIASESGSGDDGAENTKYGQRNGFLFSLMVLSADIMQSDGKIMHSEMEYMRRFLKSNFGQDAVDEGEKIIRRLFERRKQIGKERWNSEIGQCCRQIASSMPSSQRLQLLSYLVSLSKADGKTPQAELQALYRIAASLGMSTGTVDQMMGLGGNTLDDAYRVLGITRDATDDEVRKAYKQMALKHHPDHVSSLGEDIRKAAEEKFKEINDAKDRIYKSRGMK